MEEIRAKINRLYDKDTKIAYANLLELEQLSENENTLYQYLEFMVPYKKELNKKIKDNVLLIDGLQFKDTMQPLIEKDIQHLLTLIKDQ